MRPKLWHCLLSRLNRSRRRVTGFLLNASAAVLLGACAGSVTAQNYPAKPIKIIVPFPTGGTNDVIGRVVGEKLARALNQSVVIENHGGAGGVIGTDAVAKSAPDGYTLLEGAAGPLAIGLGLFRNVPYDVLRDFAPISMLADVSVVLVVHPSIAAKSVKELIALAKARPGQINAGLPGLVTPPHLLAEMFRLRTGIDITLVPYKGGGPAVIDLIAGQIDIMFVSLSSVVESIRHKRIRAIAVANAKRSDLLPEIPTTAEAGFPGMTATPWMALLAPAATPEPIIDRLNMEVVKIMKTPAIKDYLGKQGANPLWSTPAETRAFIRDEIRKWAQVVKEANLKLE
jgi:tripartite-type tricarboxylate transporter receptor subunit TctC